MKVKEIEGWKCNIISNIKDSDPSVIYWGVDKNSFEIILSVNEYLSKFKGNVSYILVVYEVPNWNLYFSPWKTEINNGKTKFDGNGIETLNWLINKCIPYIEKMYDLNDDIKNRYIAGYSLAGLFSLWAFYKSGKFGGVSCCSGSLWYPGWKNFVLQQQITSDTKVYLSLGKKEEKTLNVIMSQVGDVTRWQYEQILHNDLVVKKILEWHNGGHFYQIDKRIACGLEWLLE